MAAQEIFLDSNLLLLLVIGKMDREYVSQFKRTNEFSPQDFDALSEIVSRAGKVVTTPHILTEVSNLANQLTDDRKESFSAAFKIIIDRLEERFIAARTLSKHSLFHFGIADISALHEADKTLILTQDGRFSREVFAAGGQALDLKSAIGYGKDIA